MKNSKKGFTLVELIIVVAVIALLAAVLIPTFSSLISKANQAKDEALVSNLNKAVALSTEKYDNVHDVLDAVKANAGFDVAKISASVSEHEILWDSVNYCFVYKTTSGIKYLPDSQTETKVEPYQYWSFVKDYEDIATSECSVYWYGGELDESKAVNVSVGFDAGNYEVKTVNYTHILGENVEGYDKVVIRTKGGNLTVNAPDDTVTRYGMVDNVTITEVAPHSYHEKGEVRGNLLIEKGKLEIAKEAVVNTILVAPQKDNAVEIITEKGSKVNLVVPTTVSGENYVKNSTDLEADTKLETQIDYDKVNKTDYVGGLGTLESPYLIATGEQAYKMRNGKGYFKLIDDVVVNNEIYMSEKTYVVDLNGHTIRLEYAADAKPNNGGVFNISGKKSSLTINDSSNGQGKVIGSDKTYANKVTCAVRVGNYAKLTINGGHFYGTSEETSCIFVMTSTASGSKGTVVINGGTFETATPDTDGTYYVLNHQDSSTTGCTITVNGGSFKNYNPGVTKVDPVNAKTGKIVLGTGCKTTETKDGDVTWYIVSK